MKKIKVIVKRILIEKIKKKYFLAVILSYIRIPLNIIRRESKPTLYLNIKDVKNYKIKQVSRIIENNLYGLDQVITKYTEKLNSTYIEHGLFVGSFVHPDLLKIPKINLVITFGEFRKEQLIKSGWVGNIKTIGPYILQSKTLINRNETEIEKKKNGKTLLFFPSHSINGTKKEFDKTKLPEIFKEMYPDVKTFIICLYYIDFLEGEDTYYKSQGYIVTSAGNKYDKNFLPRLRSLIEISDYTASNKIGTHVGYCLSLGKPHHHLDTGKITEIITNPSGELEQKSEHRTNNQLFSKIEKEYIKIFEKRTESITIEQKSFLHKYFE